MNGYTENKAARYRLPNTTTMEDLAMEVEETGLDEIECRLNLTAMSQEVFEDGGHAIEWAMLR